MIEQFIEWDKELLLFLNSLNTPFLDFIMYWISDKFIWIPFYLLLLILIIKKYKIRTIYVLVGVAILITLSDITSHYGFKEVFQCLRPCHNESLKPYIHLVNNTCGGQYSFISSHAANTFALALYVIQTIGHKYKFIPPLIILWACIVSYSRIYLGVHFPFDVLCGALVGSAFGLSIGKFFNFYYSKYVLKSDKQEY